LKMLRINYFFNEERRVMKTLDL